ncbi:hypothetical protein [Candidatus Uabimicrobium sp. HlEnr_7]|uniref:hypothetical protein n=1 Tax=Candidatus Uabimicrobium helgolandensis TaxID=3095367 RepID=UPI003555FCC6
MEKNNYKQILSVYGHLLAFSFCIIFNISWYLNNHNEVSHDFVEKVEHSVERCLTKILSRKTPIDKKTEDILSLKVQKNWNPTTKVSPAPTDKDIYPLYISDIKKIMKKLVFRVSIKQTRKCVAKKTDQGVVVSWRTLKKMGESYVSGYELVKQWKNKSGKKQQKTIYIGKYQKKFVDNKIQKNIYYSYKVRAFSYDLNVTGGVESVIKSKRVMVSPFASSRPIRIISPYKLELIGVSDDFAMIKLKKYHNGKYIETVCNIRQGTQIEAKNLYMQQKRIDFSPGWKLLKVIHQQKVTAKEKKYSQDKFPTKKKMSYSAAIIYLDDKQNEIRVFQEK